ncbi:integrin alpha-PS1-like isoform X1 [Limulus polyphemus]|uniref:Integrin alpha-PS1-like isoform X1 n=1 Tax=Limulus polyphemus TaxID=6850 RepID=A0ABM1S9U0_LIMPO|nr:integrin alpha-PS1-like isoform X1 [Limulus polyphemus]
METKCWCWTLFFYLISIHLTVNGFNLETRLPLIKESDSGSYFGFSVAQHIDIDDKEANRYPVLLVGAPLARNYRAERNHSGALYKCELKTYRKDCSQIDITPDSESSDEVDKDGQWLGVTVASQKPGGYVVTCAHRYVIKGLGYRWGEGICYSFKSSLVYDRQWQPCQFLNKGHEEFGYCQAGVSVYVLENNEVAFGTPGPYTWKGTLFVNNVRFDIWDDTFWHRGPLNNDSPVGKYSYLGMSVTGGKFFGSHTSFVGGAPRSNGTGQVVFFKKLKVNDDSKFSVEHILDGEQFLSSFGYALASLDINGDGALDLAVGAPFYFSEKGGGAVYAYINTENDFNDSKRIKVTGKAQSAFGLTLSNAGDLNKDGYSDLAVGAPYEESGKGAVYIYLGSAEGLITKAAQAIRPSDFPEKALPRVGLRTFGYSLSGGLDMDSNGYPDLLIGAYESDAAILLRSRPIIGLETTVTGNYTDIDPQRAGCIEDPTSNQVCFSFSACFKITDTGSDLKIRYKIEEAASAVKYYRVIFNSSYDAEAPNVVTEDLSVSMGERKCKKEVIYLKDKTDIQTPIKFKLLYSLIQEDPPLPQEGDELPDLNKYPILNKQKSLKIFEATFLKNCGDDEVCQSNLELLLEFELSKPLGATHHQKLYLGEKFFNISVTVRNYNEPAYNAAFFISHPKSISYVNNFKKDYELNIECKPVTESLVKCTLGNPFTLKEVVVQVKFDTRRIRDDENWLTFDVKVNTTSVNTAENTTSHFELEIIRLAELKLRGVSKPEQVLYSDEIKEETVMMSETDVGTPVIHTYEIINDGPFRAREVQVEISWPYELGNNKNKEQYVLYLMETPKVYGNGYCLLDEKWVNPHSIGSKNLAEKGSNSVNTIRRKREAATVHEEKLVDGKAVKYVALDCENDSFKIKCLNITCTINNLEARSSNVINIKALLWNSTFVQEYPKVDYVSIISRGKIHLISSLDIEQNTTNDEAKAETKAYSDVHFSKTEKKTPILFIIVSVACGILLLVIVVIILWRCGFFRRPLQQYTVVPNEEKSATSFPETS